MSQYTESRKRDDKIKQTIQKYSTNNRNEAVIVDIKPSRELFSSFDKKRRNQVAGNAVLKKQIKII